MIKLAGAIALSFAALMCFVMLFVVLDSNYKIYDVRDIAAFGFVGWGLVIFWIIIMFKTKEYMRRSAYMAKKLKDAVQVIVDKDWQGTVKGGLKMETDGSFYATVIDQDGDAHDVDIDSIEIKKEEDKEDQYAVV